MATKKDQDPVEILFDREELKVQEARAKAQEFATVLLEPNFSEPRFYELLGDLNELGYDRAAVTQCMLSRLAFHEALGDNGDFQDRWVKGLTMLEATVIEVDETIREAQQLRTKLAGKSRDEISLAIYERYFNRDDLPSNIVETVPVETALETVIG